MGKKGPIFWMNTKTLKLAKEIFPWLLFLDMFLKTCLSCTAGPYGCILYSGVLVTLLSPVRLQSKTKSTSNYTISLSSLTRASFRYVSSTAWKWHWRVGNLIISLILNHLSFLTRTQESLCKSYLYNQGKLEHSRKMEFVYKFSRLRNCTWYFQCNFSKIKIFT